MHCILCGDEIQSGKTYCVAFCAPLALLAGSGVNACDNGRKNVDNEAREDVFLLIYVYLGSREFILVFDRLEIKAPPAH